MIPIGALVRVMNAVRSDSILVGTVVERWHPAGPGIWTAVILVKVQPAFGAAQWVLEDTCEVLQPSDQ